MFNLAIDNFKSSVRKFLKAIIPRRKPPAPEKRWRKAYETGKKLLERREIGPGTEMLEESLRIAERYMGTGNWRIFESRKYLIQARCEQGRFEDAFKICDRLLAEQTDYFGENHPEVIESLFATAYLCCDYMALEKAAELFRKGVPLSETCYGRSNREMVINFKKDLATVTQAIGNMEEAAEIWNDLYETSEALQDWLLRTISIIKLAVCRSSEADIRNAIEMLEKLVGRLREPYTTEDYDLLPYLKELAAVLQSSEEYDHARTLLERIVEMEESFMSDENCDILHSISELAFVNFKAGDYREAEKLLLKGNEIWNRISEDERKRTGLNWELDIATFYNNIGKNREAEKLLTENLERSRQEYPEDSPELIDTLNNLSLNYHISAQYVKSEELLREIHRIAEKHYGRDHLKTSEWKMLLGLSLNHQRRFDEARSVLLKALRISEKHCEENDQGLLQIMSNLAYAFLELRDYNNAELLYSRVLAGMDKIYHHYHEGFINELVGFARSKLNLGKFSDAEKGLDRALGIITEQKLEENDDNMWLAKTLFYRARCYSGQERYEEAESEYIRSMLIFERHSGEKNPYFTGGLYDLGNLYLRTGRLNEAQGNLERLRDILRRVTGSETELYRNVNSSLQVISEMRKTRIDPGSGAVDDRTLH